MIEKLGDNTHTHTNNTVIKTLKLYYRLTTCNHNTAKFSSLHKGGILKEGGGGGGGGGRGLGY